MAILAAGVGFGIRGGIFANWGADYGFSGAQLGAIGGAGFTGFCFGIIIGGIVVDKIGYGKLVFAAFLFHVLSAFVTFGASSIRRSAYTIISFLGHVHLRGRKRHSRSGIESTRVDPLPRETHPLSKHPSRLMACSE